jgi:hypothetical protein
VLSVVDPAAKVDEKILLANICDIPSDQELVRGLTRLPALPGDISKIPLVRRPYEVGEIRRTLHIPTRHEISVARTVDMLIRDGYSLREPSRATTWKTVYSDLSEHGTSTSPALAALIVGVSGVGKSECVRLALQRYPQTISHDRFPKMEAGFQQLVWIRAGVPGSGKLEDLVEVMIEATADALNDKKLPEFIAKGRSTPLQWFNRWAKFVKGHFLGLLFLDEIQNLFKIPTLKDRQKKRIRSDYELRIADDQTLKALLMFCNDSSVPLLLAGTHDSEIVLRKRFAIAQRLTSGGHHRMEFPSSAADPHFTGLLKKLIRYQWSDEPLPLTQGLAETIYKRTAGIHRILISLWIGAHRVAAEAGASSLTIAHIEQAASTYISPARPAVDALLSGSADCIEKYEDLIGRAAPV